MNICREAVLNANVLEIGEVRYATGKRGNNILNFDRIFEHEQHMRLMFVAKRLGSLAFKFKPDLLVGVPRGGERFAEILAQDKYLGVPLAHLVKTDTSPGSKTYDYAGQEDQDLVEQSSQIVLIEDVFHELISVRGVLAVPGIQERTRAAVAVWDRGYPKSRIDLEVQHEALVTESIPKYLHEYDELYGYGVRVSE